MNLVTGATGLVGAHVALELLQKGKSVTATKRSQSDIKKVRQVFSYYTANYDELFSRIKWIDADINDIYSIIDALEGIETVYHCAGFVSFNNKDYEQMHKINTEGTANVVNACLEKGNVALCYVSSIATISNPDITKNIDESVYWKSSPSASVYAITKYNGEREVWRGIEEGLNAVIVNPGIILGPGFWNQSSGKLFRVCYKGLPFYTSGASSYIDVRDVALCMIKCIDEKLFNQRYILIENNYSFKEIFDEMLTQFGNKKTFIKANKWMLNLGRLGSYISSLITGKEQLITKETVIASFEKNTFSNAKIKQVTKHQFINAKDSIQFNCAIYLNDLKK